MGGIKTYIVDSFTNQAFKGNPAGVCIIEEAMDESLMLSIAQELNLSETAYVQKMKNETYSIRYFSPKMEIPLCGHATLAASKVLFRNAEVDKIHFVTVEQLDLLISRNDEDIIMEFPLYDTIPAEAPRPLLDALGIDTIKNCVYNKETKILLLEIEFTEALTELSPDFNALYNAHEGINGVLITALDEGDDYDFHSRYFWPWSGTDEDPVTGGTHTFLTKYWAARLNKRKMKSFQSSKRTGFMEVEIINETHFLIKGKAVVVFEGKLLEV